MKITQLHNSLIIIVDQHFCIILGVIPKANTWYLPIQIFPIKSTSQA